MPLIRFTQLLLRISIAFAVVASCSTALLGQAAERPNFVFIQGEGQGWASTSVQLAPDVPESKSDDFWTPNLERLAREGVRFSNFYAPSPRCTPSRATYFTGISPARLGMTFTASGGDTGHALIEPRVISELPREVTTIAELLKSAGYATAHFGKWHVGRADPRVHGFDESDGATSNSGPENSRNPNPKQAYGMTDRGIAFMKRQVAANKPFYLQLSHYGGRSQADAKPETFETVLKRGLGRNDRNMEAAAVVLDMDITIGLLLDALNELGIADNTYVIYTADHGTPGRNGPLQGGKGGLWDGGIRIPLFIRGPLARANAHCSTLVTGADLVPTVADLAGLKNQVAAEVEGGSLRNVLSAPDTGTVSRPNDGLVFHFPHYDKDPLGPVSAIVLHNFKLLRIYERDQNMLFDLRQDMGERNDLAATNPSLVHKLDGQLTRYLTSIGAKLPVQRESGMAPPSVSNSDRSREDTILKGLDKDSDGQLTQEEIEALPALLRSLDKDRDGSVSREEARGR
ncbi:MAG: sulfatase-like hydrolase/transferase [Planctomycetales bacterium]|nr:sulfatase-like hydrolase/transferase [Planctomycetales bacterium]